MFMKTSSLILTLLVTLWLSPSAMAQWTSQTLTLTPGWNAVFLEVQPEPRAADLVFSGIPVDSAWDWNRQSFNPQYIDDVNQLVPQVGEWATWFPQGHVKRSLANFFEVRGGRPLLLFLNGTSSVTWTVTGMATRPLDEWLPSGYTLTGFHVEAPGAPTFRNYFQNSAAHVGTPVSSTRPIVRSLNSSGQWAVIASTSTIQPGKAYWVETLSASSYPGPLSVTLPSTTGMHYGLNGEELEIVFNNSNSTGNRTVNLRLLSSLPRPPTATNEAVVAGDVRLSFRDFNSITQESQLARWLPFDSAMSISVEPGVARVLRLAVRRSDFLPPAAGAGSPALYQSLLEVREGGTRQLIPITALKTTNNSSNTNRAGLWVGTVSVNAVSWAGAVSPRIIEANPAFNGSDRTTPKPTKSDFVFRVIIHIDAQGTARLLQKVVQVWQNGTYQPDPANPGLLLPGTSGQFRLFTDDTAASSYVGTGLQDGTLTARRLSTPIFGIHQPVTLTSTGLFGDAASSVSGTVITPYDDPLNPFKHAFHPQHDNWDASYASKLPAGVESWNITREVRWDFTSTHPYNLVSPAYGDTELGGNYGETLSGVHRHALKMSGKFLLHKVSSTTTLN